MIGTEYSFHFVYSCGLVERGFVSQFRGLTDSFDSSAWNTPLSRLSVSRACCTASLLARAGPLPLPLILLTRLRGTHHCLVSLCRALAALRLCLRAQGIAYTSLCVYKFYVHTTVRRPRLGTTTRQCQCAMHYACHWPLPTMRSCAFRTTTHMHHHHGGCVCVCI